MSIPNFFIVGAPKCGTTAINDYLAAHPDVFMAKKELHYFGSDLPVKTRISQKDYLSQFTNANGARIVGEASVWYLYSQTAAEEIRRFQPDARILIMLRQPVTVMYAMHSQHLYDGNEDIPDFDEAIAADERRTQGLQPVRSAEFTALPSYFGMVRFAAQVKRYLYMFGPKNVKVVLHEDFVRSPDEILGELYSFLGIPNVPVHHQKKINANRNIRGLWLHRLVKLPPAALKTLIGIVVPLRPVRHYLMARLLRFTVRTAARKPMPEDLWRRLNEQLVPEIDELARLLGRNLDHWKLGLNGQHRQ